MLNSFMVEIPIIWFLYDKDLRQDRVNFHACQYSSEHYKALKINGDFCIWANNCKRKTSLNSIRNIKKLISFFINMTEISKIEISKNI